MMSQGDTRFDSYIMVDWSASSQPAHGENSIWIGWAWWDGDRLRQEQTNPGTRREAIDTVCEAVNNDARFTGRVLLGFDFPFGYPAGFTRSLRIQNGRAPWQKVFNHFEAAVHDNLGRRRNKHNRDSFAAACNAAIGGGPGPFWGCHRNAAGDTLTPNRNGIFEYPYDGLARFRRTETASQQWAQPMSVWQIGQGVSVGGQAIMGIRYLNELRQRCHATVWPFETGWQAPDDSHQRVCLVEIFPSIIPLNENLGNCRDEQQVASVCQWAARDDSDGQLTSYFMHDPNAENGPGAHVHEEEGWIFGVPVQ